MCSGSYLLYGMDFVAIWVCRRNIHPFPSSGFFFLLSSETQGEIEVFDGRTVGR